MLGAAEKGGELASAIVNPGAPKKRPDPEAVPSEGPNIEDAGPTRVTPQDAAAKEKEADTAWRKEADTRSQRQYPWMSQGQQRSQYYNELLNQRTKQGYAMEKTNAQDTTKENVAAGRNASREQVEYVKGQFKQQDTATKTEAMLKIAAEKIGSNIDKLNMDRLRSYLANGQPVPEDMAPWAAGLLKEALDHQPSGGDEGGHQGPISINTQGTNPNEGGGQQRSLPPTMTKRGPDGQLHQFVLNPKTGLYQQQ